MNSLPENLLDESTYFTSIEDIPEEWLDPNYFTEEEIIPIPEEYFELNNPDMLYQTSILVEDTNSNSETFTLMAAPLLGLVAAGIYTVPGVGQVAITVTGTLVIGGLAIKGGSYLYNKVTAYFSKKTAEKTADKIPNDIKSSGMKVDLKKFKDKNGNTPLDKSSGTFKSGKWTISKDTGGHLGYNGNPKAWKIGNPTRVGSLDKYGNIIGK